MSDHFKYPRTYHVPWSLGTSSDDRLMTAEDIAYFADKQICVTEKLDGENTTMYRDHYHARSLDSRPHDSQNWARQLHSMIRHEIPDGWRVCGENLYAKHSIFYDQLTTFFHVFSIWDENNNALSWKDTVEYTEMFNDYLGCDSLGIQTVPVLYEGPWDEAAVRACWSGKSLYGEEQEGYVVRNVESFPYPTTDTTRHEMPVFRDLAKYVRPKHVRTDEFWRSTWTPNKLKWNHEKP
jgi:hypothetical protein